MQESQIVDAAATVEEVCAEYGSVREFCRQLGEKGTRRFYRVLEGASRSGSAWYSSGSKNLYAFLEREGLLKFVESKIEGTSDD